MKKPNYWDATAAIGRSLKRGEVAFATVYHDSWCKQLKGTGPCNCNPDVEYHKVSDSDSEDQKGNPETKSS